MVAENCERTAKVLVESLHCREQAWPLCDPRFSGAGRDCDANSESLLQQEPWREGTHECSTAVIDNVKVLLGKPRGCLAAPEAPQCQMWPAQEKLRHHFAGTA